MSQIGTLGMDLFGPTLRFQGSNRATVLTGKQKPVSEAHDNWVFAQGRSFCPKMGFFRDGVGHT
jgi:hypothetical protein